MAGRAPRVAIVHDWLTIYGGAERVLDKIADCFPGADLYTSVDFLGEHPIKRKFAKVVPSFIQSLPRARTSHWYYAPMMPLAFEQFNLSDYDIIISSSHAFAKGVIVHPHQVHVCYLHSPPRFIWDLQADYFKTFGFEKGFKRKAAALIFHYLRHCDRGAVNSVDHLVSNSQFVRGRAIKCYRRDSDVIYPCVDVADFTLGEGRGEYFLAGSYMNPFKRLDLVVEAFKQMPQHKLLVFGDGPQREVLQRMAGANVIFTGAVPRDELIRLMQGAKAYVFAAAEDFGIVMAEAQAAGAPVIAFGRGGAVDIVRPLGAAVSPTGVFFEQQDPVALRAAVELFERNEGQFDRSVCRANAMRFAPDVFVSAFQAYVLEKWRAQAALPVSRLAA
jgi:glycosyltransferase involved in cell wall biosynthesis